MLLLCAVPPPPRPPPLPSTTQRGGKLSSLPSRGQSKGGGAGGGRGTLTPSLGGHIAESRKGGGGGGGGPESTALLLLVSLPWAPHAANGGERKHTKKLSPPPSVPRSGFGRTFQSAERGTRRRNTHIHSSRKGGNESDPETGRFFFFSSTATYGFLLFSES